MASRKFTLVETFRATDGGKRTFRATVCPTERRKETVSMFHYQKSTEHMLVYLLEPGEALDHFSLNMLREHPVEGVLPVGTPGWTDPNREDPNYVQTLLIPIAGCEPLTAHLQEIIDPSELPKLLRQVDAISKQCREFMIPERELLLNLHFTYYHRETQSLRLLCLPAQQVGCLRETFRDFARSLYAAALHESMEHLDQLLLGLYKINDPTLTDEQIHDILLASSSIEPQPHRELGESPRAEKKARTEERTRIEKRVGTEESTRTEKNTKMEKSISVEEPRFYSPVPQEEELPKTKRNSFTFRMKRLLQGTGGTDSFDDFCTPDAKVPEESAYEHVLTSRATGQDYILPRSTTIMGADSTRCHLSLKDNPFAEQEHCRIFFSGGHFFLEDLNSDSGTWVNSAKLNRFEERPLESADIIRIGREEWIYSKRISRRKTT